MNMKRDQKITVIEYVHTADGGVQRVDELEPERYARFREWLIGTWFNELHRGMAEVVFEATGAGIARRAMERGELEGLTMEEWEKRYGHGGG